MSKKTRLFKKIQRLEVKLADVETRLDNAKLEYNYLISMEDDSKDWECDE